MSKFAKRLKELRLQRNFTQDQLAEYLTDNTGNTIKISRSAISMYERGEREPDLDFLNEICDFFGTTPDDMLGRQVKNNVRSGIKIPVLGRVVAGVPIEAVTDIIDYEEITPELAATGDFFALQIKGDSMTPRICENDVVIVRKQPSVDSGSLAIVLINGEAATIKQVIVREDGIMLQAFNPAVYPTHFYTCEDIKKLPITVLGKVVELRGKFM